MRTRKKALIVFISVIIILVFLAITSSISLSNSGISVNFTFSYLEFFTLNNLFIYIILIFVVLIIAGFSYSIKGERYWLSYILHIVAGIKFHLVFIAYIITISIIYVLFKYRLGIHLCICNNDIHRLFQ